MTRSRLLLMLAYGLLPTACGQDTGASAGNFGDVASNTAGGSYRVLNEDLQQLKDDFNANHGRVRLLFLSGPTCGICLRGMADLNDEFIAAAQSDNRLVTFVVHVPTVGAKEEHVAASIPLLDGPRVHHYWDGSGIIGNHYRDVMGVEVYVWDFWTIYGPDARWEGVLPPPPDYYEHQLAGLFGAPGGFPRARVLNASRFAATTGEFIDKVDASRFSRDPDVELNDNELLADGTVIPVVAQPRNVAVSLHIRGRGGYSNLKRIRAVKKRGWLRANGGAYQLTISTARPNLIRRTISVGDLSSVAELSDGGKVIIDENTARGLSPDAESKFLKAFEFDGLFVEWPDKGHEVTMLGMLKIGDVLAWKLELIQKDGPRWHLFVNSHGGELVQASLLADNGEPEYVIRQSDFRETSGFLFAHRVEYLDRDGRSLAVEEIDDVVVDVEGSDMKGHLRTSYHNATVGYRR